MKLYQDKVALVTGGASGIGKACIEAFAGEGAKVVIADMNVEQGQALQAELEKAGSEALFVETNVADPASVKNMVVQTIERFGQLDAAVNNAGIEGTRSPLHEGTSDNWEKVIGVNLSGVYYCMQEQVKAMLPNPNQCAIVNMASILGTVGAPTVSPYVATKHAVIGLTKSAALEYSAQGIRVNAVCPGFIETPLTQEGIPEEIKQRMVMMHPIGRLGKSEEVAQTVVYLCSDKASFVTGSVNMVDGGYTTH